MQLQSQQVPPGATPHPPAGGILTGRACSPPAGAWTLGWDRGLVQPHCHSRVSSPCQASLCPSLSSSPPTPSSSGLPAGSHFLLMPFLALCFLPLSPHHHIPTATLLAPGDRPAQPNHSGNTTNQAGAPWPRSGLAAGPASWPLSPPLPQSPGPSADLILDLLVPSGVTEACLKAEPPCLHPG